MKRKSKFVYLASPYGFAECTKDFMYNKLIPSIEEVGYSVINPWDLTPESEFKKVNSIKDCKKRLKELKRLNNLIGKRNVNAIKKADGVIAVLDGVDVDSGVASEIGYGFGLGKWIIGYRNDFRNAGDNEASIANLQVVYFILSSGGYFVNSLNNMQKLLRKVVL